MNINLTLIGQTITFIFFVAFCMKFVWPPIVAALNERKQRIADGLASADKGQHELELAKKRAVEVLKEAKTKASEIINHAEKRAAEITDEAKEKAKEEADRILVATRGEVEQESHRAREQLRTMLAGLVVAGASKVLEREIKSEDHVALLDGVIKQL